MNYTTALEMARTHNRRAAILLRRLDRTLSGSARTAILRQINEEQTSAAQWTDAARIYKPLPRAVV